MDRGYVDFRRLYAIHQAGAFFVTRTKINMKYHRVYSHPVPDKTTGVGSDQSIALDGFYSKQDYPQHLSPSAGAASRPHHRHYRFGNTWRPILAVIVPLRAQRHVWQREVLGHHTE